MNNRAQMAEPSLEEVQQRLQSALRTLARQDSYLLDHDLHERTITHKLAEYLQPLFPDWNVDCEYNRDGHAPKRVRHAARQPPREDEGSNVFPDIIIHQRGTNEHNILVLEAKKAHDLDQEVDERDRAKVEAFAIDLDYRCGALVVVYIEHEHQRYHATFYSHGNWTPLDA